MKGLLANGLCVCVSKLLFGNRLGVRLFVLL